MKVAHIRPDSGLALDFARQVWESIRDGGDVGPAVRDAMVAQAIARFTPHVVAALRRAGLDVPDGEPLSLDGVRQAINAKTGLDIAELSEDGIKAAIEERIAARLSDALGVTVTQVMDGDALRAQVKAAALSAVQSGRANALMPAATIRKIRAAATWGRAGVAPDDRRRWLARWYAKKWRRTHVQRWDA